MESNYAKTPIHDAIRKSFTDAILEMENTEMHLRACVQELGIMQYRHLNAGTESSKEYADNQAKIKYLESQIVRIMNATNVLYQLRSRVDSEVYGVDNTLMHARTLMENLDEYHAERERENTHTYRAIEY